MSARSLWQQKDAGVMHSEKHLVSRIGWMRAAVLGANDGIISTASIIVGVAAAATNQNSVLIAGIAGGVCAIIPKFSCLFPY